VGGKKFTRSPIQNIRLGCNSYGQAREKGTDAERRGPGIGTLRGIILEKKQGCFVKDANLKK